MRDLGSIPAPMNSFLLNVGLETLHLRMPRHCENAIKVATYLQSSDKVAWVNCPMLDGDVRLVATTWEWAEDIDQARAEASKKRAEEILARKNLNDREYELAQARLKRALVRTSVR